MKHICLAWQILADGRTQLRAYDKLTGYWFKWWSPNDPEALTWMDENGAPEYDPEYGYSVIPEIPFKVIE